MEFQGPCLILHTSLSSSPLQYISPCNLWTGLCHVIIEANAECSSRKPLAVQASIWIQMRCMPMGLQQFRALIGTTSSSPCIGLLAGLTAGWAPREPPNTSLEAPSKIYKVIHWSGSLIGFNQTWVSSCIEIVRRTSILVDVNCDQSSEWDLLVHSNIKAVKDIYFNIYCFSIQMEKT